MSISAVLLGLINIAIVAAVLIAVGLVVAWFAGMMGQSVPDQLRKIYLVIVLLVVLYMVVALLFGLPTLRPIGGIWQPPSIIR